MKMALDRCLEILKLADQTSKDTWLNSIRCSFSNVNFDALQKIAQPSTRFRSDSNIVLARDFGEYIP